MIRFVFLTLVCSVALASAQIGEGNKNCTESEEWKECATCDPTCDNKQPICFPDCKPSRCMCREGFYRSNEGKCVTDSECDTAKPTPPPTPIQPVCKNNEKFFKCTTYCEAKCGEWEGLPCIRMCGPPGCQCADGFYRNSAGECASRADCESEKPTPPPTPIQPVCKNNEKFFKCSTLCEAKCGEWDGVPCFLMCGPPACQCSDGFYRNSDGECVSRAECENEKPTPPRTPVQPICKKNEQFFKCSTLCESKCGEWEGIPCPLMCGPPACQCSDGFYRNSDGECVSRAECEANLSV